MSATKSKSKKNARNDEIVEEILIPGNTSTKARIGERHCAECTRKFHAKTTTARYCSSPCKSKFNAREALRGAHLYRVMYAAFLYSKENPDALTNPYQDYADRLMQGYHIEDIQEGRAPSAKVVV